MRTFVVVIGVAVVAVVVVGATAPSLAQGLIRSGLALDGGGAVVLALAVVRSRHAIAEMLGYDEIRGTDGGISVPINPDIQAMRRTLETDSLKGRVGMLLLLAGFALQLAGQTI